jgi:FKBP-type peptidyl-prolyl cis-trans isomerase
MYRIKILSFFALFSFIFSCKEKPTTSNGYSKKGNFYYKLISIGDETKKTDNTKYLYINATCKTLTDSVFWSSKYNANQSFFVSSNSSALLKDLYAFSAGDSLQYLFPTTDFFRQVFNSDVPFFCEKDSCVKFSVKIMSVFNQEAFSHFNDSVQKSIHQKEENELLQMQQYASKKCKHIVEFAPNAYIEMLKITDLDSVKKGKKIKILYKGYFLDGTLVDYTPKNWAFELVCGQEGQLVQGLQLALYQLKKGEKAKIILPSHFAFGKEGSSNGAIPPFTPMVYELEVIDVN